MTEEEIKIEKSKYTRKIFQPIYEPKNVMPSVDELYDTSKRDELTKSILEHNELPEEVKTFLLSAAERHTRFNFSKIADFYAHCSKDIKKLFEESALVIVDYDDAIKYGFIAYEKAVQESVNEFIDELEW